MQLPVMTTLSVIFLVTINLPTLNAFEEPYCGLYSMHAALNAIDLPADINDIIDPNFVNSEGSTAPQLAKLANRLGAIASIRTGLSIATLRSTASPVLLRTSTASSQAGFHHWVLFLGTDADLIRIYEPHHGLTTFSTAELLSFWDGSGIIVERPDTSSHFAPLTTHPLLSPELLFAFILVLLFDAILSLTPGSGSRQAIAIFGVALSSALIWHSLVAYGFFFNRDAFANITPTLATASLPTISTDELTLLLGSDTLTIVDSRTPADYARAHIPGAINIPITIGRGTLRNVLSTIPRRNQVVVYCKSRACDWAGAVASLISLRGYPNVSVYREGLVGWPPD